MSKENTNENSSAFVRYMISCEEVIDVGIGHSVKGAISSFMKGHGLSYRITDFESSSDKASMVLEIHDSGDKEFYTKSLNEHLKKSNRLPTNLNKRPKVVVTPISIEKEVKVETVNGHRDVAWEKTVLELRDRINNADGELLGAKELVSFYQRESAEKDVRIMDLEKRIAFRHNSATNLDLLIDNYFPHERGSLKDASCDWDSLKHDRESFIEFSKELIADYITYVNKLLGKNFESEEKFEEWRKLMERCKRKGILPGSVQDLIEHFNSYDKDTKAINTAREAGASHSLIQVMKKNVEEVYGNINALKEKVEEERLKFDKDIAIYDGFSGSRTSYEIFEKCFSRASSREVSEAKYTIIFNMKSGSDEGIKVYVPSVNSSSDLEKYLHNEIRTSLNMDVNINSYKEKAMLLSPVKKRSLGVSSQIVDSIIKRDISIVNDKTLESLGIKPNLITLIEG